MSEQKHDNNALATLAAALISAAVTMACSVNQFSNYQPQLSLQEFKLILKQPAVEKKDSTVIAIIPPNTQTIYIPETDTLIKASSDTSANINIISNLCCIEPDEYHNVTANKKQHQIFYDPVSTFYISFEKVEDGWGKGYWGHKDYLSDSSSIWHDGEGFPIKVCAKNYQVLFNSFKTNGRSYNISINRIAD